MPTQSYPVSEVDHPLHRGPQSHLSRRIHEIVYVCEPGAVRTSAVHFLSVGRGWVGAASLGVPLLASIDWRFTMICQISPIQFEVLHALREIGDWLVRPQLLVVGDPHFQEAALGVNMREPSIYRGRRSTLRNISRRVNPMKLGQRMRVLCQGVSRSLRNGHVLSSILICVTVGRESHILARGTVNRTLQKLPRHVEHAQSFETLVALQVEVILVGIRNSRRLGNHNTVSVEFVQVFVLCIDIQGAELVAFSF